MTGIALLLVLATGVWGMLRDLHQVAESIIQADVAKFQSHAERTVSRIESEVRESHDLLAFVEMNPRWFEELWVVTVRRLPEVLYGAVLDLNKLTIEDSTRLITGEKVIGETSNLIFVPSDTNGVKATQFPFDAILLPASAATGNKRVLDATYPIRADSKILGFYRVGMDYELLQTKIRHARSRVLGGWAVILATITFIVVGACISLYRLGLHTVHLEHQLSAAEIRRVDELHRLIIGLAHEVRNPLNAIRLNLFASKKILRDAREFDIEEAASILDESVEEIERMDDLIGQLLGYARVVGKSPSIVKVNEQVDSVLRFLGQSLDQSHVKAKFEPCPDDCTISMDPQSLRQILINLLQNACQAMSNGGRLVIRVSTSGAGVQIEVHDSGPGLDDAVIPRIFEPFFSTRDDGVGMGLAVVKGLVESSRGSIACGKSELLGGMKFRVDLPLASEVVVG